jgi:hypothetical protein
VSALPLEVKRNWKEGKQWRRAPASQLGTEAAAKSSIPASSVWLGGRDGLRKHGGMSANPRGVSVKDGERQGALSPMSSRATIAMVEFSHWRRKEKEEWRRGSYGGGGTSRGSRRRALSGAAW